MNQILCESLPAFHRARPFQVIIHAIRRIKATGWLLKNVVLPLKYCVNEFTGLNITQIRYSAKNFSLGVGRV